MQNEQGTVPSSPVFGVDSSTEVPSVFPNSGGSAAENNFLPSTPSAPDTTPVSGQTGPAPAPATPVAGIPQTPTTTTTPPVSSGGVGGPSVSQRKLPLKRVIIALLFFLVFSVVLFVVFRFVVPRFTGGLNKNVEITYWGLWEDTSLIQPLIDEYQTSHPGIKVKYVPQSKEDYRERLTNSLAKGEGPDIFRFHNSWVPMFRSQLSLLPSSVMTAQEFSQTFYPVAVSDLASGTGFVGIPLMYDGLALFVNEDILATFGKTVPKTWNELLETSVSLTVKDTGGKIVQSGASLGIASNVDHWQEILALMILQNRGSLVKPNDEFNLAPGALDFYTAFNKDYGVWNDTLPNSTLAFSGGKVAFYVGPSWRVHEILAAKPTFKFKTYPVPQLPKDSSTEPDITYATYWVEGVWEESKNKDASWEFLKFLSSKESLEKLYTNTSSVRTFGEIYSRVDMREQLLSAPYVSAFVALAPNAKSWYLASRTFDGTTGINSSVSKYYEDAINTVIGGRGISSDALSALTTATSGIEGILSKYGLVTLSPQTSK